MNTLYGSTPRTDLGMDRSGYNEGPFMNMLNGQGVAPAFGSSQTTTGFGPFRSNERRMAEGGSSQRGPDAMHDFPTTQGPTEDIRPKKGRRTKNFSKAEDLLLASAWLNVSTDPIHGTNQSSTTYWGRITEYYHEHKGNMYSNRNQKSLNARWSAIQEHVNKFCGWLEQVNRHNRSGATDVNKIAEASKLYSENEKKHFTFMHCFDVFQHHPKWTALSSNKKQKTSAAATPASSPAGANYVDLDGDTPHSSEHPPSKPIGCKATKAARRRSTSASSVWNESVMKASQDSLNAQLSEHEARRYEGEHEHESVHEKGLLDRHQQNLALQREKMEYLMRVEEKKLELKRQELEALQKQEEMKIEQKNRHKRMEIEAQQEQMILHMAISKLDDDCKEYYIIMRKKLLARARGEV